MTEEKMREIAHKHALQWVAPPGSHWFPTRDTDEVTMQNVVRGEEIIFYAIKDAFARPEALRSEPDPLTLELADELFGCFLSRAASDADHSWQCAVCDEPVPMPDWITSKHAEGCAVAKARDYLAQHAPHRTPGFVVSPLRQSQEKT